jgi:tripeptidyl-peptidase-1
MFFSSLAFSCALATLAVASPVPHVVHETRTTVPAGWEKRDVLDRRAILPMKIALAQGNLDKGWDWLKDVSHPESANYGQHWSAKDVAEAFAPSQGTVDTVKAWLASAGIDGPRVKQSKSLNWLEFSATVDEAEELLKTKYNVYEHESGQPHIACEEYSIPAHLQEHVEFVLPTVHFDAKLKARDASEDFLEDLMVEKRSPDSQHGRGWGPGKPWGPWKPPGGGWRMPKVSVRPAMKQAYRDIQACVSDISV